MSSTTVAEFANELKKSPEVLLEQLSQRFDSGVRQNELATERGEGGLDRDEIRLVVIDDQNVAPIAHR